MLHYKTTPSLLCELLSDIYGVPFVSKFTFTRHTEFRGNLTPRTVDIY